MALLVRAIGRAGSAASDLCLVESGPLCAWASRIDSDRPLGREEMMAHHAVVESLGECLPVRFGTVVADDAALAALLHAQEGSLLAGLTRVEGRRELAVTGLWRLPVGPIADEDAAAEGTRSGRQYLEARQMRLHAEAEQRQRAAEVAGMARLAAGVAEADARHVIAPSGRVAFSSALLVSRSGADLAIAGIEAVDLPDVRLLVHGPWPPYTFAATEEKAS